MTNEADRRLAVIREKVEAGERLAFDDGQAYVSRVNLLVGDFRHAAMGTIVLRQTKIARTTRESRPPGRR
jgi:hypothetical protein